jgi:MFS family permease
MPALLNFCAQVPNTGFSAFLPLWALGRGVANPGVLFVASQAGSVASRLFAGRWADRHGRAAVLVPALAGEAAPPQGRGAALNTFGLGSDLAQLLGPWGLGLAAGAWGFGGALVAAGLVATVGMAAGLARGAARR